jgi:threonine dehydrogenase-like Zn-dependent dehydrogenase
VIEEGSEKGKKVVLNPLITCGECNYCKNGREHLCAKRIILGMNKPIERQGCFAELVLTPDKNIYELPSNLDIKQAPIAEPTAVALHAVELCEEVLKKPIDQSRVLVIGGGAIGLLCALILEKYKKCKEIVLVDPNEKRLKVCGDHLNSETLKPDNLSIKDSSFDMVFDTVGLEITRQNSIKSVNPGGVIIHIGLTQPSGTFNFRKATLQEITFVGTYCYTNKDFENTLKLLSSHTLGKLEWIEYRELSKGADAFKQIHNGTCSAPKIILIP